MSLRIRPLEAEDRAGWEALWQGYLRFYEEDLPGEVTEIVFQRLLDPAEPMVALVAEGEGALLGLVHCVFHRGTWSVSDVCYLEDLFTAPAARGQGVGRALIEAVYELARGRGVGRVYWVTQEGNKTAQALYEKLAERADFIQYRKSL
ncbi:MULTISPECIES: GNAT family N-acetyltransferase [Acidocella]|uniref:GNAT family N-acetyltransferase n=1 Tax=Acidocella TaxID=50709 RepID=UPI00028EED21|nr:MULTISPECIES: GNAT family N-acetyltransferase [Acidocella]EKN01033.1 N-acetyltransferase GCN5 [Acidocella sp. MX-AZ02]WBO60649.1 GNAT family N-acetyltransferase [Acidocella sp. MX-AZ03]